MTSITQVRPPKTYGNDKNLGKKIPHGSMRDFGVIKNIYMEPYTSIDWAELRIRSAKSKSAFRSCILSE